MHKGVILILKAKSRADACSKADDFMEEHENVVWDWWVVGGRWTGLLDGYQPEKDRRNWEKCSLCFGSGVEKPDDPTLLALTETEHKLNHTPFPKCRRCNGKRKTLKFGFAPHAGDVSRLSNPKTLRAVRKYLGKDWAGRRVGEIKQSRQRFTADGEMQKYYDKCAAKIACDEFCFDSNVYDVDNQSNSIPKIVRGLWAVVVDMHN